MILLDTKVVSELMRRESDGVVERRLYSNGNENSLRGAFRRFGCARGGPMGKLSERRLA
jgi:hypothetical protein